MCIRDRGATDCDKIGKTFHDLGIPTDIKESDKPTVRQISVNAVSYTHLDVYKRQPHISAWL